jgi:heptosyltransferase-2
MPKNGITVIITMAGLGSRFRMAGYTVPKYEIEVQGHSLFYWSLSSLKNFFAHSSQFIFIARREDDAFRFIKQETTVLEVPNWRLVEIDCLTDGQATTVLCAETVIENMQDPILIYNIDTYVNPKYIRLENVRGDGWIPCFHGIGDAWSFARKDASGHVVEVREKLRISDHATLGLYYFSSYELYRAIYNEYYAVDAMEEKGERYIAPLYNGLICKGYSVYIDEVPAHAVHPLGTPEDVKRYATSFEPAIDSSHIHILIVKHGALGDVVRTSYFATALRQKFGDRLRLSWITDQMASLLIRFNPNIDDVWSSYEECRKYSFDLIYSLDDEKNILTNVSRLECSGLVGAFIDKEGAVTYTDNSSAWFDMGLISKYGKGRADELKRLNTRSHADIFSEIFNVAFPSPEFWGNNRYKPWIYSNVVTKGRVIGVNPFAGGRWPSKELPPLELKSLCSILLKSFLSDADTLILLGANDDYLKNQILSLELDDGRIWVPNTDDSVLRLASVIASLDYLITSDSLALHLAIAQKIPFAAFFAPTSAVEIDDFGCGIKILSTSPDYCSYSKDADNASITAERILEAITIHRKDIFYTHFVEE